MIWVILANQCPRCEMYWEREKKDQDLWEKQFLDIKARKENDKHSTIKVYGNNSPSHDIIKKKKQIRHLLTFPLSCVWSHVSFLQSSKQQVPPTVPKPLFHGIWSDFWYLPVEPSTSLLELEKLSYTQSLETETCATKLLEKEVHPFLLVYLSLWWIIRHHPDASCNS